MADRNVITVPDDEVVDLNTDIGPDGRSKVVSELWQAVSGLESRGTFACSGQLAVALPGLNIIGYGEVGLPLRENELIQIISLYKPASSSQSADEEMDASPIGHTWQLEPPDFRLSNKAFMDQINSLVVSVGEELGLGPTPLNTAAKLSKLLIETKDSSTAHWNIVSDLTDRTFATLVVTLPSIYEGGEFVVQHQGWARTFKQENAAYSANYVAFFSGLEHEVQPITSGFRLSLVYNIVSLDNGPLPIPADNTTMVNAMDCLHRWISLPTPPSKAVFIVEHKYSKKGVPFKALRHRDKDIARILQEITHGTNIELYVTLLTRYSSRWNEKEYETYDIHLLNNAAGDQLDVEILVNHTDVFPEGYFNGKWSEKDRYLAVALVLLSKDKFIEMIATGDWKKSMDYIMSLAVKNLSIEDRNAPEWQSIHKLTGLMLENHKHRILPNVGFLETLLVIGDVQLVQTYLDTMVHYHLDFSPQLEQFCDLVEQCLAKFGWEVMYAAFYKFLTGWLKTEAALAFMTKRFATFKSDEKGCQLMRAVMEHFIKKDMEEYYFSFNSQYLVALAKLAAMIDSAMLDDIFKLIYRFKYVYREFVPALKVLHQNVPGIENHPEFVTIAKRCIASLQARIAVAQTRHDDWSFHFTFACPCEACRQATMFLRDPTRMEFHFRAVSGTRVHMESSFSTLAHHNLVSLSTITRTTPYTLVVTKINKESNAVRASAAKFQLEVDELMSMIQGVSGDGDQSGQERAAKRQKTGDEIIWDVGVIYV